MKIPLITLILALSLIASYDNKASAQDSDTFVLSLSKNNGTATQDFEISKYKLSQEITYLVDSIISTENVRKIDSNTVSFSAVAKHPERGRVVFNNIQCFVYFSFTDDVYWIHFSHCESDETIFANNDIKIQYTDIDSINRKNTNIFIDSINRKNTNIFIERSL